MPDGINKQQRKYGVLEFYKSGRGFRLTAPPKVAHINLMRETIPRVEWSTRTTRNLIDELKADGLLEESAAGRGYVELSDAGARFFDAGHQDYPGRSGFERVTE